MYLVRNESFILWLISFFLLVISWCPFQNVTTDSTNKVNNYTFSRNASPDSRHNKGQAELLFNKC